VAWAAKSADKKKRWEAVTREKGATRMPIARAINTFLIEYIQCPFQYLRESSAQARLAELIKSELKREKVPLAVAAAVTLDRPHRHFFHGHRLKTNRIQLEMKIGRCQCESHGKTDLLLLNAAGPVNLTCHRHGPTDVVADIDAEDVDVAIEIKACPSSMGGQRKKCRADVTKLYDLVKAHRGIRAYFLMLDKSVSIPELATASAPKHMEWVDELESKVRDKRPQRRPFVEICDIDAESLTPRRRFYG
jgi:hypothetical protein